MKKIFLSLAALVMTMSAPMMTSCSSEDLEEVAPEVVTPETGTHEETLTIAFPEQAETRVGVGNDNKLTGWEEGDEVTLVQTGYEKPEEWDEYSFSLKGTYTFSCTDAAKGTFRGTLPNDVSVKDCQLAFYNATDFAADDVYDWLCFSPKNRASQDMKDVVMLVAKNDGEGHFTMQIFGSILAVTNENNIDITASVKYQLTNDDMSHYAYYYDCAANAFQPDGYFGFMTNYASSKKHTFTLGKNALTYVYLPVFNIVDGYEGFAVGVSAEGDAEDECSLVPFKTNPGNAKLFKKTLKPFKIGTAKATIGGSEVDVNWVQLWEDGPKFAEYNVGVTDGKAESYGGYYAWGGSQDKVDDHNTGNVVLTGDADTATKLWGSAWRMPTKAELDDLLANCDVEWTTVNGVNGRKFTGKGDFDSNSVFLPAAGYCSQGNVYENSSGHYWSSTPTGNQYSYYAFYAYYLYFNSGDQYVSDIHRFIGSSVRAVLAE